MNKPIHTEHKDSREFWYQDEDLEFLFGKTKRECREVLKQLLAEYDDLIKRMKYV